MKHLIKLNVIKTIIIIIVTKRYVTEIKDKKIPVMHSAFAYCLVAKSLCLV